MKRLLLAAAMAAIPLLGTSAHAASILFDTDGTGGEGTKTVGSFTFAAGNSRASGALPTGIGVPTPFVDYYEAVVASINDGNGVPIGGLGLNATYQYTIVLRTPGIATTTINPVTLQPNTTFSTGAGPSLLQVYFDTNLNADNLNGTGFNDGTLVLSANVTRLTGNFNLNGDPPSTLDNSPNGDQWSGQQTRHGDGGFSVDGTVSFFNTDFFKNPPAQEVHFVFANGNTKLPYDQVDPAKTFFDGTASNVGLVNGDPILGGPDILIQTTGTASFGVVPTPEAATAGMALTALVGIGRLVRRRRA
jgi:hypothetical protein